jgi:hypothetical protein
MSEFIQQIGRHFTGKKPKKLWPKISKQFIIRHVLEALVSDLEAIDNTANAPQQRVARFALESPFDYFARPSCRRSFRVVSP